MPLSPEQIAEAALALTSDQRAELADLLVESLDPADDATNSRLWATEAMRRRDEVRSGSVLPISGPEAIARVKRAVS